MTGTSTRPADYRGQRPLHPGDDDDDPGGVEPGVLAEQPVETGDPDVVQPIDRIPHYFGRHCRFFGDGEVGRAGGGNEDRAAAAGGRAELERDAAGEFVVAGVREARREPPRMPRRKSV